MRQAIAGVAPPEAEEVTVMTIWPSIAAFGLGRLLGKAYSINVGFFVFTLGNLAALISIPGALKLYFFRLFPAVFGVGPHGTFYRLTNRSVQELRNEVYVAVGEDAGEDTKQRVQTAAFAVGGIVAVVSVGLWLLAGAHFLVPVICCVVAGGMIGGALMFDVGSNVGSPTAQRFRTTVSAILGLFVVVLVALWVFEKVHWIVPIIGAVAAVGIIKVLWMHLNFGVVTSAVELDRFDRIEVKVQPGQEWFKAGDLIFYLGDIETFRLLGVSRPETFRQTCMKAHLGYVGVKDALSHEAANA